MLDITALILEDHAEMRRLFAALDDAEGQEALAETWTPLAHLLDLHADAEEKLFYPALLKRGKDGTEETEDAIGDHNDIRDGVRDAAAHRPGTKAWREAVDRARKANSEHLAEEEREALADFRRTASDELRAELGARWLAYKEEHAGARGIDISDKDPQAYLEEHS